jgi:glutathione synthase/RimK-type ligase-like ATP-grasp enzyme
MKDIKLFEEWLSEQETTKGPLPLQILSRGSITSSEEPFVVKAMKKIHEKYCRLVPVSGTNELKKEYSKTKSYDIDFNYPILNFSRVDHAYLNDDRAVVFNELNLLEFPKDKVKFHKGMETCKYVPKTVYDLKSIKQLTPPIIAKPVEGRRGIGIEIFDTHDDVKKTTEKFLWSEAKDIKKEFRSLVMGNKIIYIADRVMHSKGIKQKKPGDELEFVYIDQDVETFPHLEALIEIKQEINKHVNLDFYSMDFMIDKSGDVWLIELNNSPNILPTMFYEMYKVWLQIAYGLDEIPKEYDKELSAMRKTYLREVKAEYKKEYSESLNPAKP